VLVDWPGFGESTRGRLDYGPRLYHKFLADFAAALVPKAAAVIAAGHAASYALVLARDRPGVWSHAVLLTPTWQGPLPTAMGEHPRAYAWARRLVGTPVIGEALYRLNTLRSVIGLMYRRHVYSEAGRIAPAFIAKKQDVARWPGARFGSVAFVTGNLDPGIRPWRVPCVVRSAARANLGSVRQCHATQIEIGNDGARRPVGHRSALGGGCAWSARGGLVPTRLILGPILWEIETDTRPAGWHNGWPATASPQL
jgi:pimeloyl-ACP methyl ester carboxylesterase